MKKIATLALIMALLGFPAVNANADTFTLWDNFPQLANGDKWFWHRGCRLLRRAADPFG